MSNRIVDVGTRLSDPGSRLDLAWEVIAVMFHANDEPQQQRRQSAGAATLLAMRDGKGDDKEVRYRALARWQKAGGFKTSSEVYPYFKQQLAAGYQIPSLLMVGDILGLMWAMKIHHDKVLTGGPSISKAIAVLRAADLAVSERTLWSAWKRYATVAHFCAAFAFRYHHADPECIGECMKIAFDEHLQGTLVMAASFQRFGTGFKAHSTGKSLLDPADMWLLKGIEPDNEFLPPPLPSQQIAAAQQYKARPSVAYR